MVLPLPVRRLPANLTVQMFSSRRVSEKPPVKPLSLYFVEQPANIDAKPIASSILLIVTFPIVIVASADEKISSYKVHNTDKLARG